MEIKVNNISFNGIEFKNPQAKKIFTKKLKSCSEEGVKDVLGFIEKQKSIKNKAIINVTEKSHNDGEKILFATFSHDKNAIVVDNRGAASVMDFLNRCAAVTGYEGEMLTRKPKHTIKERTKMAAKIIGQVF